jgi:hypothetical protein
MKKPNALTQLLEELQGEAIRSDVETTKESKATIYLSDDMDDGIELTGKECVLLFANTGTVSRLLETLESSNTSLLLHDLTVSEHVFEALEEGFSFVDDD